MPRQREKLILANGPTPKVLPQSDEKPLVYLSHTVVSTRELEKELLDSSGARYRCFSFVYIVPDAIYFSERALESYKYNVERKNHLMMDSGAFSFHMFVVKRKAVGSIEKVREKTIEQYIQFCKQHHKEWDFYVTFDYEQHQPKIWEITKRIEAAGLRPVPVYHGDRTSDWLKKWLDAGYRRIGISNLPWRKSDYRKTRLYLDEVFRVAEPYDVKLHGFAVTSLALMYAYPWYSCDSSSWSRASSYGAIYGLDPERGTMASIHVSLTGGLKATTTSATSLSPEALESVRNQVEVAGWDLDLLRRSLQYRFIYNAHVFAHLNQWKKFLNDKVVKWESLL